MKLSHEGLRKLLTIFWGIEITAMKVGKIPMPFWPFIFV